MPFLLWFLTPVGRIVGIVGLCMLLLTGVYTKGRYDDHVAYTKKLQREAQDAIQKATDARSRAVDRFDAGSLPDDGFRRD